MGASGWTYFVPYQSDIAQALNELREQVFRSGKFYKREPFWQDMDEDEFDDAPDEDLRQNSIEWLRTMKAMQKPTTIEELLMWNEEDGTHSIIDISDISPIPKYGCATPLSAEQLMHLFGILEPTHIMVEQRSDEIVRMRKTLQATYIVVYKDGVPDEIFFAGFSGD